MRESRSIHDIADTIAHALAQQNQAVERLINTQLNRARTRVHVPVDGTGTTLTAKLPSNNSAEIQTIVISAPSATALVNLTIGSHTIPLKVTTANGGLFELPYLRHKWASADTVSVSSDASGYMSLDVYGEQIGDGGDIR